MAVCVIKEGPGRAGYLAAVSEAGDAFSGAVDPQVLEGWFRDAWGWRHGVAVQSRPVLQGAAS